MTMFRWMVCGVVVSVGAVVLLLQTSSAQHPPQPPMGGAMSMPALTQSFGQGVVRVHGAAPHPVGMYIMGDGTGMPMDGPMHGGMGGGMPMPGMPGMDVGPAMPHPPVDKDTLGLCVKAMLLNFRHGSVEMIAPLFKMLPPEAKRNFLTHALEIAGDIDFDSFDAERRKTLGAAPEHSNDAAAYRRLIDSREQRARLQVTVLAHLAASLLVTPQFAQPPVPHGVPGHPSAHPPISVGGDAAEKSSDAPAIQEG